MSNDQQYRGMYDARHEVLEAIATLRKAAEHNALLQSKWGAESSIIEYFNVKAKKLNNLYHTINFL